MVESIAEDTEADVNSFSEDLETLYQLLVSQDKELRQLKQAAARKEDPDADERLNRYFHETDFEHDEYATGGLSDA
jgi:ABC-type transporter Mla subunit MlaD